VQAQKGDCTTVFPWLLIRANPCRTMGYQCFSVPGRHDRNRFDFPIETASCDCLFYCRGFLTPFRVKLIATKLDEYVYTLDDKLIEVEIEGGTRYEEADFNKIIEIREREKKRV
jgi:hypothetical protein